MSLVDKRQRIRDIDAEIMDLAAERTRLAREIGAIKRDEGRPVRDYVVEAEVIRLVRDQCQASGFSPDVGENLVKLLIRESLRVQELDRRAADRRERNNKSTALVIGGRGNMGRWFCEFLDSRGFGVTVADPRGSVEGYAHTDDPLNAAEAMDLVLVASPPSTVGRVLEELEGHARGLVVEISSLKSPFLGVAEDVTARGMALASIHPMWGPFTDLLANKNLVVCDCGDAAAVRAARALFEDTAANIVEVPLREHDALMASTLGLPHALNLAFSRTLAAGREPLARLRGLGGPTFTKQVAVADEVADENKDLYYEIQRLNDHTPGVYEALRRAIDDLERSLENREAFRSFMQSNQDYHHGSGQVTP